MSSLLRISGLAALLLCICISPRIEVPVAIPARAFDLRFEDVVLLVLVPAWVVWLVRSRRLPRIVTGIGSAFALYLGITLISSLIAVELRSLNLTRSVAYWGKEVELLFILLIAATWVWNSTERRLLAIWLLVLGFANTVWAVVQMALGERTTLLHFGASPGAFQRPHLLESYGPASIGEISPLSVGALFMIIFLIVFAGFALAASWRQSLPWLAASAAPLTVTVAVQSRVSIAGCALGAAVIAVCIRRYRRVAVGFVTVAAISLLISYATGGLNDGRLTVWRNIEHSVLYRVSQIWEPLLGVQPTPSQKSTPQPTQQPTPQPTQQPTPQATQQPTPPPSALPTPAPPAEHKSGGGDLGLPILGHGSGAMGASGLPTEAHDHFLRVYLESGLLGLGAFALLLVATSLALIRVARGPIAYSSGALTGRWDRVIAITALAVLTAFLGAALVQDMFLPVLPNELLWFLVGLALSMLATRTTNAPTKAC